MNNTLSNICGYELDKEQFDFVTANNKTILLVASAGSGKTLCLIGKIKYLIEVKNIKEEEILCISYTNEAVNNLKNKLLEFYNYNIEVKTFHKLALSLLDSKIKGICPNNYLDYIIDECFNNVIYNNIKMYKIIMKYLGVPPYKKNYIKSNSTDIINLKRLLSRFINLFKSNNYNLYDFYKIYNKNKYTIFNRNKNKLFLKIAFYIYQIYMEELDSTLRYDFNDIINLAISNVGNNLKYKYIIIDEYQDTSIVRLNLIKKIIEKTNAGLIVVGDDYQSIYRFTGCDLNIFLNFNKYFKDASIMYLNTTYRNSMELASVANKFICKNKLQMKKNIYSNKHNLKPIKIIYYNKYNNDLFNLLNKIKNNGNILILGRNTNDIKKFIDTNKYNLSDYNARYLTVHQSKGLESDNVIIINLEDRILGFPNKLEDDNVLKYVILNKEKYVYDEERRLFYVALTRSKNNVYIISNQNKQSIFLKEIVKYYKNYCEFI